VKRRRQTELRQTKLIELHTRHTHCP
jgi:hypothetical protein